MYKTAKNKYSSLKAFARLPLSAKALCVTDAFGMNGVDPGIGASVAAALAWLCRAQDQSLSRDGRVARHFSITTGWGASYPETTGYIVPTMLEGARLFNNDDLRVRAKKMLDWLVSIQMEGGGFQGGLIDSTPVVPVTFNTGQILLGLAAGFKEFGEIYLPAMTKAADWLAQTQDPDGCWRKFSTPFAAAGEKAYETHVSWGLLEAARLTGNQGHENAALRNIHWALQQQRENGWFDKCCLIIPEQPLTHTIGYVLRGVLEGYRYFKDPALLAAAMKTADGLLNVIDGRGFIPGRLNSDWHGTVTWSCLTGTVQIAHCWLMLYQETGDVRYRDAAFRANAYVRKTVAIKGNLDLVGGVRGSFPIFGKYGQFEYLNWACKFFIDSNVYEQTIRKNETC